jgi:hypothetical protein
LRHRSSTSLWPRRMILGSIGVPFSIVSEFTVPRISCNFALPGPP